MKCVCTDSSLEVSGIKPLWTFVFRYLGDQTCQFLCDTYPKEPALSHMVIACLVLQELAKLFSRVAVRSYILTRNAWEDQFLWVPASFWYCHYFAFWPFWSLSFFLPLFFPSPFPSLCPFSPFILRIAPLSQHTDLLWGHFRCMPMFSSWIFMFLPPVPSQGACVEGKAGGSYCGAGCWPLFLLWLPLFSTHGSFLLLSVVLQIPF